MTEACKVTYINHSSFLVETAQSYLLFDYWKGEIPVLDPSKPFYIFSSHSHHDHYSKEIFKLENSCQEVYYILSSDIKDADSAWANVKNVTFLDAHEKCTVKHCEIETLLSTDVGVAFMLQIDGISIYHAGDLHRWEWPGEDAQENAEAIRNYEAEMEKIAGRNFDLAFVVLDPRQEEVGGMGLDLFLEKGNAQYIFPMHLWGDYSYLADYIQKKSNESDGKLMKITRSGETFLI